jgi:hypothetical protein
MERINFHYDKAKMIFKKLPNNNLQFEVKAPGDNILEFEVKPKFAKILRDDLTKYLASLKKN